MKTQINDFLNYLMIEKGFSGNTIQAYRNDLYQLEDYLISYGSLDDVNQIDSTTLSNFVLNLQEKGYTRSSLARKIASIKSFLAFLVNEGILPENPGDNITAPKIGRTLPTPISEEEINRLLGSAGSNGSSESIRDKAMLEILYATGMRVTEMVSLDKNDINLAEGYVKCMGKGAKERLIPIHDSANAAVTTYLEASRPKLTGNPGEPALFVNHRGERLTRQGFWLILKDHAQRAGIQSPVTPHTLRHSFATHMLQGGASLRQVQEFLGHSSIASTQIYTHLTDTHIRSEFEKAHPRARSI